VTSTAPARPKRALGQNFLRDQGLARKIVAALEVRSGDQVLEIGPGQGALTRWLRLEADRFLALEKDPDLARKVRRQWPEVDVVAMDALRFAWERLGQGWRLIGNLPYNVASPLIWEIVARTTSLEQAVFMVQNEVAQRLSASPGSRAYGALSVWVQSHVQVRKLFVVGPGNFYPRPRVDSAVIRFLPGPAPLSRDEQQNLRRLLHICFQQRRKQIKTILKPLWRPELEGWLSTQNLDPSTRPERFSPDQFQALARLLFADK
jgi:16S rRNA (adenine1518-N6/adenine1519-N6)-dimethyltransferase